MSVLPAFRCDTRDCPPGYFCTHNLYCASCASICTYCGQPYETAICTAVCPDFVKNYFPRNEINESLSEPRHTEQTAATIASIVTPLSSESAHTEPFTDINTLDRSVCEELYFVFGFVTGFLLCFLVIFSYCHMAKRRLKLRARSLHRPPSNFSHDPGQLPVKTQPPVDEKSPFLPRSDHVVSCPRVYEVEERALIGSKHNRSEPAVVHRASSTPVSLLSLPLLLVDRTYDPMRGNSSGQDPHRSEKESDSETEFAMYGIQDSGSVPSVPCVVAPPLRDIGRTDLNIENLAIVSDHENTNEDTEQKVLRIEDSCSEPAGRTSSWQSLDLVRTSQPPSLIPDTDDVRTEPEGAQTPLLSNATGFNRSSSAPKKMSRCSSGCLCRSDWSINTNLDAIFTDILQKSQGAVPDGVINIQLCKAISLIELVVEEGKEDIGRRFMNNYVCNCVKKNHFDVVTGMPEQLLGCGECGEGENCPSLSSVEPSLMAWIGPGSPILPVRASVWEEIKHENFNSLKTVEKMIPKSEQEPDKFKMTSVTCCITSEITNMNYDVIMTCGHGLESGTHPRHDLVFLTEIAEIPSGKPKVLPLGSRHLGSYNNCDDAGNCTWHQHNDSLIIFPDERYQSLLQNRLKPKCSYDFHNEDVQLRTFEGELSKVVGKTVTKYGLCTGHTCGRIVDTTGTRCAFKCKSSFREDHALFYVEPLNEQQASFAGLGDSGSLVVEPLSTSAGNPVPVDAIGMIRALAHPSLRDAKGRQFGRSVILCTRLSYCTSYFKDVHSINLSFPNRPGSVVSGGARARSPSRQHEKSCDSARGRVSSEVVTTKARPDDKSANAQDIGTQFSDCDRRSLEALTLGREINRRRSTSNRMQQNVS